jgi:hypothetical protein
LGSQGPILETYLERGRTVTSSTYCDGLERGLKPAIHSKRRGKLLQGVLLLHENTRRHTATRTMETLRKLKWEVTEHPAHSQDLVPSEFHFLDSLKKLYEGEDVDEMGKYRARCIRGYMRNQRLAIYYTGIKELVGHWEKFVEKQDDYVEKHVFCFVSINKNACKIKNAESF